ncbi:MAG: glycosyltransferase, partial [Nanoarchaeota archaeon]
ISLIIPTRKRRPLLEQCLRSFAERATAKSSFDFWIVGDIDDAPGSLFKIEEFIENLGVTQYNILVREQSDFINEDYYNWAARQCKGEILFPINDDVQMITDGWDDLLLKIHNNEKDKSYYIRFDDNTHWPHNKACCFPPISRKLFNILDRIFPKEIAAGGADSQFYEIIRNLDRNIIIDTPNLKILHHCSHNKTRGKDEINSLNSARGAKFKGELNFIELNWYIQKYNEVINTEHQEEWINNYII